MSKWTWQDCECEDGYIAIMDEDGNGEDVLCPRCRGYTAYPRPADQLDIGDLFQSRAQVWRFIEQVF